MKSETKTYYVGLFSQFQDASELARAIGSELGLSVEIRQAKLYSRFAVVAPVAAKELIDQNEHLSHLAHGDLESEQDDLSRLADDDLYQESIEWRVVSFDSQQGLSTQENYIVRLGDDQDDFID